MKRILSLLLCLSLLVSMLPGCGQQRTAEEVTEDVISETNIAAEEPNQIEDVQPIIETVTPVIEQEPFEYESQPKFTGMDDESLLPYIEDEVYVQLVSELDSTDYFVESVSTVYISKEYLQETAYNSKTNIFFGYSIADLDAYFEGTRYVFTLGDDGQTTVEPLEVVEDTTYEQVLTNVAVGTGVILVCIVVSVVTEGTATAAVSMIFAVGAQSAAACALSGAVVSGVTAAVVRGYQTGDLNEALKAGAVSASEGYKWGAISGALTGGASEAWGLYSATGKGLTMNDVAIIQKESGYPLSIIRQFHTMKEYEAFKDAGLEAQMVGGKLALVRKDIDLYNIVDEQGRNNYQRLSQGLNPIDGSGKTFEWHHIGQENDATLALLTGEEHDRGGLHGFKVISEIDRNAFNKYKPELNRALLAWLTSNL